MVLALSGGVGGAKLVKGLATQLPADKLTIVVNTADDFEHLELYIAPDVDTVMYTLAGLASRDRGWGLTGETWNAMGMLERYGAETWFQLGDQDLVTHILRTQALRQGRTLSEVTADLSSRLGVAHQLVPMTDTRVTTYVQTPAGWIHFQEYFVRDSFQPEVLDVQFRGLKDAAPSPSFQQALAQADAVILTPSNPVVSLGPILGLSGVREALRESSATCLAVTPLIGAQAVKGPTVPLMRAAGWSPTADGVARLYAPFLDIFVLDQRDEALCPDIEALGLTVHTTDTLMQNDADKVRLAEEILSLL